MSTSLSVITAADDLTSAVPGLFTHEWWTVHAETLITKPVKIVLVVALAAVVRLMVNRGIRRLTDRTATGEVPSILRPWRRRGRQADPEGVEQIAARRTQRAEAIGSVL